MTSINTLRVSDDMRSRILALSDAQTAGGRPKPNVLLSCRPSDTSYAFEFAELFGEQFCCSVAEPSTPEGVKGQDYVTWLKSSDVMQAEFVLLILLGPESGSMKKIDWDTAAALSHDKSIVGGLLGVLLPEYFGNERQIPPRLSENTQSGYASVHTWKHLLSDSQQFTAIYNKAIMRSRDEVERTKNDMPLRRLEY